MLISCQFRKTPPLYRNPAFGLQPDPNLELRCISQGARQTCWYVLTEMFYDTAEKCPINVLTRIRRAQR